jgi:glycosyltransferase involved in cell wall biosynthesis/GT2 family glycosyltransferase
LQRYPTWSVLVLTDFFFPDSTGGANRVAYYTSRGLAERGHRVRLVTRRIRPDLSPHEVVDGIHVCRYDLPRKSAIAFQFSARRCIWHILDAWRAKERFSPNLVIIHQPLLAKAVRRHPTLRNIPWLYAFHSPWGEEFLISRNRRDREGYSGRPATWLLGKIRALIEASVLRQCQIVLVLSAFMGERLKRLHRVNGRVVIVPGGVDIDSFCPAENIERVRQELNLPRHRFILLTVRNLRKRMGLANLISAIASLGETGEQVHLVLAGKGELEGELKTLAREMNVAHQVTFSGHISEQDLPRYYQAADLFVLPTEHLEGFGMSTLEALATGTPVIGTPVGATPEILRQIGEEWLTRDSSREALAEKIIDRVKWMKAHPAEYQSLKRSCRDFAVRHHSWPDIIARWEEICDRTVIRGGKGLARRSDPPGTNWKEQRRQPARDRSMREFVKHRSGDFASEVTVIDHRSKRQHAPPALSVIIPTLDGHRQGHLSHLLDQLERQSFRDFESIIIKGDKRQGRAINTGASAARGRYLLTLDDDTVLGHEDLFAKLVQVLEDSPQVGMAGVPNVVPEDASWFVKHAMLEIPRRSSPMVRETTISDMAEHPCLIMRRDVFFQVGGENELIPRGLDPYLRQAFRDAGYHVVVIPDVYIHHLPPDRFWRLVRQFFRNGKAAAYVDKFYPQWVYDLTTSHEELATPRVGRMYRLGRQVVRLVSALIRLRFLYLASQGSYLLGFLWGFITLKDTEAL